MVPPLPWLSRCHFLRLLLPSWSLAPQGSRGCCSQNPKASMEEQTSSRGNGKMTSTPRVSGTTGSQLRPLAQETLSAPPKAYAQDRELPGLLNTGVLNKDWVKNG
ncbi:hypothetical protein H8959_009796 [Pygathrix nigripes]